MSFEPQDRLLIGTSAFEFTPHPAASGLTMAYGQEGKKAWVYQLRDLDAGHTHALKVFKPAFLDVGQVRLAEAMAAYSHLPGLGVCDRRVLSRESHPELVHDHPELEYSVLMPWVEGQTWCDFLRGDAQPDAWTSIEHAVEAALVLSRLEGLGIAHCDISGGNVLIDGRRVLLVDVEDLYCVTLQPPAAPPSGSAGYQHPAARCDALGQWRPAGDRFSGAILIVEMLAWHEPRIRAAAAQEHYFEEAEIQDPGSARRQLMEEVLAGLGDGVAELFARAWRAPSLETCPKLSEWLVATAQVRLVLQLRDALARDDRRAVYEHCRNYAELARSVGAGSQGEDPWLSIEPISQLTAERDEIRAAIKDWQALEELRTAVDSRRVAAVLALAARLQRLAGIAELTPELESVAREMVATHEELKRALREGDDEQLTIWDDNRRWDWQGVLGADEQQRVELARQRMDAVRQIRRAVAKNDDRAILELAGEHRKLLAGTDLLDEQRVALAQRRLLVLAELRAAWAEQPDEEIWKRIRAHWTLLEPLSAFSAEEREAASEVQARLLRRGFWLADSGLLQAAAEPPLFRVGDRLSPAEKTRLEEALGQGQALGELRAALAQDDAGAVEQIIQRSKDLIRRCSNYSMPERQRVAALRQRAVAAELATAIALGDERGIVAAASEASRCGHVPARPARLAIRLARRRLSALGRLQEARPAGIAGHPAGASGARDPGAALGAGAAQASVSEGDLPPTVVWC